MRVLHVVPSYIPAWRYGGPIYSVHGLCKALAARGHEVHVATTNVDGDRDSDVPVGTPVQLDGVSVSYFPSTRLRRIYYSAPMGAFLEAQTGSFDLVHTHSVFLWPTSCAAHIARKRDRPYVVSPRGMLVKDLIARKSELLKRAWIRTFERRNVERAAAIHVTSRLEGEELLALGFAPARLIEVPNGWDNPRPVSSTGAPVPPEATASPYVLFLGRISWKKGLDRLIRALARTRSIHLVVAGNDDEGLWPTLEALIEEHGLRDRVHRVGFVYGAEKERLVRGARVLALTSYSENFGNVVLEAMGMGVPVVITPEVGLGQVVGDAQAGVVVDGQPGPLGAAIESIVHDEDLRARLSNNALRAAVGFSWTRVAGMMEQHYLEIVRSHAGRP